MQIKLDMLGDTFYGVIDTREKEIDKKIGAGEA